MEDQNIKNIDGSSIQLRRLVHTALFAALIAAGAFIAIPIGPVPIVLQNLFVLLAGLILGAKWGLVTVAIYLLAGIAGLPVFAGGTGGIARILGPTGGYLLSYLPVVFVVGLISNSGWTTRERSAKRQLVLDIIAMFAGTCLIYLSGVPWLKTVTGMDWQKAITLGMVPFLIGDLAKIIAAVPIAKALRPIVNRSR